MKAEQDVVATFPGTSTAKAEALVREFGADVVSHAAGVFRPEKAKGGKWAWFRGICARVKAEGGPPGEPVKPPSILEVMAKRKADAREKIARRKEEGLPPLPPWDQVWSTFSRVDPDYLESLAAHEGTGGGPPGENPPRRRRRSPRPSRP